MTLHDNATSLNMTSPKPGDWTAGRDSVFWHWAKKPPLVGSCISYAITGVYLLKKDSLRSYVSLCKLNDGDIKSQSFSRFFDKWWTTHQINGSVIEFSVIWILSYFYSHMFSGHISSVIYILKAQAKWSFAAMRALLPALAWSCFLNYSCFCIRDLKVIEENNRKSFCSIHM